MFNFTTRRLFLFPSYTIDVQEQEKLDKYLLFLERFGVSEVLNSVHKKDHFSKGRPIYNPCHLFATILYGFAFGKGTLREIESSCRFDLRYIYLMDQEMPSFKTIANFINDYILPNQELIFYKITNSLLEMLDVSFEDIFVDGSKIEADANKYKFVWKPTTFHMRLSDKIRNLLNIVGLSRGIPEKGIIDTKIIANKLWEFHESLKTFSDRELKVKTKQYNQLLEYLEKSIEYEEKERICGPDRNSYYKTDHDATAMTLKTDYYSGLGSNMHAAYNTQLAVSRGVIVAYIVSQFRNDLDDFIPLIEKIHQYYRTYPERVCADAGYGNLQNYRYLNKKEIENYVKHQSWQGNVSGRRPNLYYLNDDGTIRCLNGNTGNLCETINRHPKKSGNLFYKIEGCNTCSFKDYCKQWQKVKDENFKIFEFNPEMVLYKQEAECNLLSVKGIEMRVNRSIEVEGAFGVIKQDMGYVRFRRIKIEKVATEFMLTILGYNIRKLFRHYSGKLKLTYWKAPIDIEPEAFKKPSAKRLSNRINKKKLKNKNQEARTTYQYKHKKSYVSS